MIFFWITQIILSLIYGLVIVMWHYLQQSVGFFCLYSMLFLSVLLLVQWVGIQAYPLRENE